MKIYGFGSYFKGSEIFNDIDLLIVHESLDRDSCLDAIRLKIEIIARIDKADIVLLSMAEETQFNFIKVASAIPLVVCESIFNDEILDELESKVQSFMNCK